MILRDTLPKRRDLRYSRKESTYHHFVIKMCFVSNFLLIFKANFDVCYCERRPLLILLLQLSRLECPRLRLGTFMVGCCFVLNPYLDSSCNTDPNLYKSLFRTKLDESLYGKQLSIFVADTFCTFS
jgi:hypothetical protein